MYYTNIKDYEQLLSQHKDCSSEIGVMSAIMPGLVIVILMIGLVTLIVI